MGAAQSNNRTLTVDNEDPSSVIKVSDAVVQRLKGNLSSEKASNPTPPQPPAVVAVSQPPPTQVITNTPIYYPGESTISSIQVRREKEEQLRQNDNYWKNRITELEKSHKKMSSIMETEYELAMNEIKETFHKEPTVYQLPPCGDMGGRLMECYQKHPTAPLNCSGVFENFSQCVNTHRSQALITKVS